MRFSSRTYLPVMGVVVVLLAWELVGRFELIGNGALPSLTAIAQQWMLDGSDYAIHIAATLHTASLGFLIGNGIAIALALLFLLVPIAERLMRPLLVTLFCLPLIVVAPIVAVLASGSTPSIVLAALSVFFPTMIAVLTGLRRADPTSMDVVRSVGGGRWAVLRLVRLNSALPELLAGLQMAAPAAVLGAILGEFSGGEAGLGRYLLGSFSSGNAARLWGIGLAATVVSSIAYGIFGLLRHLAEKRMATSTSSTGVDDLPPGVDEPWYRRWAISLAGVMIALGSWALFVAGPGMSPVIAKSPSDVFAFLFTSPNSEQVRSDLVGALAESVPLAASGLVLGVLAALLLACIQRLVPAVGAAFMPVALVTQSMPLVAMTPLIVLLFGRGVAGTLIVTMLVTFFPSYVLISQGLSASKGGATDVLRSVAASPLTRLRRLDLPSATPQVAAAVRLAIPRALLGVIIAEYLVTGTGLGGLLARARGSLSYGMMWTVAVVVAILSVALYQVFSALESRILQRRQGV